MRRDEVEAAWKWIDPILQAWGSASEPPKPYAAGTWGPSASFSLLGDRTWHDLVE
jgi:glucose-6-phosphate 1-dehydrogenase